jgi:hypothetical protein
VIGHPYQELIAVMVYRLARASAALGMKVGDYYVKGHQAWLTSMKKAASGTRSPPTITPPITWTPIWPPPGPGQVGRLAYGSQAVGPRGCAAYLWATTDLDPEELVMTAAIAIG